MQTRVYLGLLAVPVLLCSAGAQDKVNYTDQILPLIEANCSKCHNSDKKKADLDLTSYQGALKGSGSGLILVSGNPDSSKLWKALTHSEEPFMPPNRPKLGDKDLDTFRKWILSGLLETANGKAIATAKAGVDLALKPEDLAKPEGPPPLPQEWPLEPVTHTARMQAITGLATSPWAPLVAVAGQRQILLFNTDTLQLVGILPFREGEPVSVKFSHNAKLLLACGGRGAKSGRVVVWDVVSGEHLMTLGQEYDTVLTADLRADQSQLALGGPGRLVKILVTKTGEAQHKLKKHTDWVTALAYSPNGQVLASADRNGGISLWDADSAQELFTLPGHKAAVTALSWRADSKLLASASEDGTVKIWELKEGKEVKSWTAHGSGALCVSYATDGRLITCGRDKRVTLWDANGNNLREFHFFDHIPLKVAFTHDGARVVASDFMGRVAVWSAADAALVGELDANPAPLSEQLAAARKQLSQLQAQASLALSNATAAEAALVKPAAALDEARRALDAAHAEQAAAENALLKLVQPGTNSGSELQAQLTEATNSWTRAKSAVTNREEVVRAKQQEIDRAKAEVAKIKSAIPEAQLNDAQNAVSRLQNAEVLSAIYQAREALATKKRQNDQIVATLETNRQALLAAQKALADAQAASIKAGIEIKNAKAELAKDTPLSVRTASELKSAESQLERLLNQYRAATAVPQKLAEHK